MEGRSYIVDDLQALPSSSSLIAQLRAEGVRAQIYEPVLIHERLLGMLGVGMATPGAVPAEHIEVIHELALQLAIGLEQVYLYEQVQRHADELETLVQERTASLEASEARFRTIFEGAGIGIALATAEGRLVATNPALRRMLGYSEQELVGMDFVRLLDNADPAAQTWLTELVARQASETSIETRYRRRDGQRGDANATVSWLREDAGAPPLVLALVDDITERKRAEEALHQANAYNRSLIEASLDPLVTIGPDGRITDVNTAAETATGRSRLRAHRDRFLRLLHRAGRGRVPAMSTSSARVRYTTSNSSYGIAMAISPPSSTTPRSTAMRGERSPASLRPHATSPNANVLTRR